MLCKKPKEMVGKTGHPMAVVFLTEKRVPVVRCSITSSELPDQLKNGCALIRRDLISQLVRAAFHVHTG